MVAPVYVLFFFLFVCLWVCLPVHGHKPRWFLFEVFRPFLRNVQFFIRIQFGTFLPVSAYVRVRSAMHTSGCEQVSRIMELATGNRCNMDLLAWYIDPNSDQAGFSPHRDRQPDDSPASFRQDGTPMYSTCWIPFTGAGPPVSPVGQMRIGGSKSRVRTLEVCAEVWDLVLAYAPRGAPAANVYNLLQQRLRASSPRMTYCL